MIAVGVGLVWAGYSFGLWGYCLIRGYDVTLTELVNPVHVYQHWPPPIAPPTVIIPTGSPATLPKAGTPGTGPTNPAPGVTVT